MPQPSGAPVDHTTPGGHHPSVWAARLSAAPSRTLVDLAERRLAEWRGALGVLGVEPATALGLPEGGLAAQEDALVEGLVGAVGDLPSRADRVVLLAPHPEDPHPDHRAVGCAAARTATVLGIPVWAYPVVPPGMLDLHGDQLLVLPNGSLR